MTSKTNEAPGLTSYAGDAVPLESVAITAEMVAGYALLRYTQVYSNRERSPIEALYTFPLAAESAVVGFRYCCGDTLLEGEIREQEQALREYAEGVHGGYGVALVERERDDVFSARVGNILPGERVKIEVEVLLPLEFVDGLLRLNIPTLVAPRYTPCEPHGPLAAFGWAGPTGEMSGADRITPPLGDPDYTATLDLHIALGFRAGITSPSHGITVTRGHDGTAYVTFADAGAALDRDLVLRLTAPGRTTVQGLVAHRTAGECGTFALTLIPDLGGELSGPRRLDVVFLLDRSDSMGGESIVEARQAIRACLRQLRSGDRFAIIAFDHKIDRFREGLVRFDRESLEAADRWVEAVGARGGTELGQALEAAIQLTPTGTIVLLTDAQVGDEDRVLDRLVEGAKPRIFSFGIGTDIASGVLQALAQSTGGAVEEIHPGEPFADKVVAQFARAVALRVENLSVEIDGVEIVDLVPTSPTALTDGEPLILLGRYARPGVGTLVVTGRCGGEPYRFAVPVDLPSAAEQPGLEQVWAARRVRELERGVDLVDNPSRRSVLEQEIVELSLAHRVPCRATAFVVVEKRPGDRLPGSPSTRVVSVHRTASWDMTRPQLSSNESSRELVRFLESQLTSPVRESKPLPPNESESPPLIFEDYLPPQGCADSITACESQEEDDPWRGAGPGGDTPEAQIRAAVVCLLEFVDHARVEAECRVQLVRALTALLAALSKVIRLEPEWHARALRLFPPIHSGPDLLEEARRLATAMGFPEVREGVVPESSGAFARRKLFSPAHDHFLEIREEPNGSPFILLEQRTKKGIPRESHKVVLFDGEIDGLVVLIKEMGVLLETGGYRREPAGPRAPAGAGTDRFPCEVEGDDDDLDDCDDANQGTDDDPQEEFEAESGDDALEELEQLIEDIQDDQEGYARSEEEGWYYGG